MCWSRLSSMRVFSVVLVLLAMFGLLPPRAQGQTDRPWEHPAGPACFELWFQTSVTRLNAHNGSAAFNNAKPYTVTPWGLIVARHQAQDRAPDNWGEFGDNKYWWLWAHLTKNPGWGSNSDWSAAGVPMPRPFILDCIAKGGPGATKVSPAGGGAGAATAPVPTAPTAVPQELRDGPWLFGRTNWAKEYGTIEFTVSWVPSVGAYQVGGTYKHDNETYWRMDGSDLLLIHKNGTVSSRLHRMNASRWEGPFLLPGGPFTHYIARALAPAPTTPPPQDLLKDPWRFGRIGQAKEYGTIQFTATWEPRVGAYQVGGSYKHDNETYWRIEGSSLLLIHRNGTISSRLTRVSGDRWQGPFLLPGGSFTHYIERVRDGATAASGTSAAGDGKGMEPGINRPGGDYRNIVFGPEYCRDLCNEDSQCRAWTFVKPGVQGEHARCWLKSSVPAARSDARTASGVKGAR